MRWPMTRRVERQATRMHEMMERLNVDCAALARADQGDAYMQARTRCLTCGTSDRCVRWLDSEQAPKRPPDFCPNLRVFEHFQRKSEPGHN
jgi:Family of unknown function (DUF6455)